MISHGVRGAVLAWAVVGAGAAVAGENLLGMPEPRDPERPGAVVLHGGGELSDEIFERFIELAGGREARIAFVPCAGYCPGDYDSEDEYRAALGARFSSWAGLAERGRVRDFTFVYTDDPEDADDPEFVRPLEEATGVWFSGGYQGRLNHRFVGEFPERTRFQVALRDVVERGGIVGGTSAGMAAMPEIMTLWQERAHSGAPAKAVAAHGLGLLGNAVVEQHFDARGGRFERFTRLLRDNRRLDALAGRDGAGPAMVGLAVEERTALIARGDRLEIVGDGHAHVFLKSNGGRTVHWHEMEPGESARLRRNAPDVASAPREEVLLAP